MLAFGSRTVPSLVKPSSSSTLPSTRMRSATSVAASSADPCGRTSTWLSTRWAELRRAPVNSTFPFTRAPSNSTRPSAVNRPPSALQKTLPATTIPDASSASLPVLSSRAPPRWTLPPIAAPRRPHLAVGPHRDRLDGTADPQPRAQQRVVVVGPQHRAGETERAVHRGVGEVDGAGAGEARFEDQVAEDPEVAALQSGDAGAAQPQADEAGHAEVERLLEGAVGEVDDPRDAGALQFEPAGDPRVSEPQSGQSLARHPVQAGQQTGQHLAANALSGQVCLGTPRVGRRDLALDFGQVFRLDHFVLP